MSSLAAGHRRRRRSPHKTGSLVFFLAGSAEGHITCACVEHFARRARVGVARGTIDSFLSGQGFLRDRPGLLFGGPGAAVLARASRQLHIVGELLFVSGAPGLLLEPACRLLHLF